MKILIIQTNSEIIHDLEFVKPIEEILEKNKIKFKTIHYVNLKKRHLRKSDKIIITGTSLKDERFLEDIREFSWIKDFKKPILGICSGMQIISLVFGSKLKKQTEIGFYPENFTKEFLGLKNEQQVYHLHNNYCVLPYNFESYTNSDVPQAIKHKFLEIYGILFHPEVRNEELLVRFCGRE